MKLYFVSITDTTHWSGMVYQLTMSDDYIPLWKKAGIYALLYRSDRPTCEEAVPVLTQALLDMCVHYLDYRYTAKIPTGYGSVEGPMEEILQEQVFNQARAILAMLIQSASAYPRARICRETEEATKLWLKRK